MRTAKGREHASWKRLKDFRPVKEDAQSKAVADTRWALTREIVEGKEDGKARSAAKGYQDTDLRGGSVETSGCVSLWSSHLQAPSPDGLE